MNIKKRLEELIEKSQLLVGYSSPVTKDIEKLINDLDGYVLVPRELEYKAYAKSVLAIKGVARFMTFEDAKQSYKAMIEANEKE